MSCFVASKDSTVASRGRAGRRSAMLDLTVHEAQRVLEQVLANHLQDTTCGVKSVWKVLRILSSSPPPPSPTFLFCSLALSFFLTTLSAFPFLSRSFYSAHFHRSSPLCIAATMSKRGGGGASKGNSFRISLSCPVGATMNCADNSGAKTLYVVAVYGIKGTLNRLPAAGIGDMYVGTVKKGKPELRKKIM